MQFAKLLGAHVIVTSSSDDKLQRAISLGQIVIRKVRLQGITVGNRDGIEAMMRAISQHAIRPLIDRTFTFEELKEALDYLACGVHFGTVCIRH